MQNACPPRVFTWVLACCLLASHAARAADDSPYRIDKRDFRDQVNNVSLTPLHVTDMVPLAPGLQTAVEQEILKRLEKARIETLGFEPYARLRETMAVQVGGLMTAEGTVDTARQAAVWDHAKREMRLRHPVDAFVEVSIRVVNASFQNDRAEWDGEKQKVKSSGDGLFGGKNYAGEIGALSFQLAFFDRNDKVLFVNRGGIEVIQERQGSRLMLIPPESLLQDEKQLIRAVRRAFDPL